MLLVESSRDIEMILFKLLNRLVAVGAVTLSGSMIAASKLDRRISQGVILNNHSQISTPFIDYFYW